MSMDFDVVIFGLDGTLCDTRRGMINGFRYALEHSNLPPCSEQQIATRLSLPITRTFSELTGIRDPEQLDQLRKLHHHYYSEQGICELHLYDGIRDMLESLHSQPRLRLGICTSKPEHFARRITVTLGLDRFMDFVCGSRPGQEKQQQLSQLIKVGNVTGSSLMVGDRHTDILAARKAGLSSAAVFWGFGSQQELQQVAPDYQVRVPSEISALVRRHIPLQMQ